MAFRYLSNSDVRVLKEVTRAVKNTPLGDMLDGSNFPNQASDVFIAKVPSTGIPGLTLATKDIPGSALCTIYKIVETTTGTGGEAELEPISGLQKRVYNLSTEPITTRYALVTKTKDGKWVAQEIEGEGDTGTGTGTDICITAIEGNILSELPTATLADPDGTGTAQTTPAYALGIDTNGCLIKIPISTC